VAIIAAAKADGYIDEMERKLGNRAQLPGCQAKALS
jgi:uncharacterized membrane protein YebE (DUF533 family)